MKIVIQPTRFSIQLVRSQRLHGTLDKMTNTYDLAKLYYKGHSPIKKQDNSFLLCLYTMLFVLFAMVIVLLLFTFCNVEPVEKDATYVHNKPQHQKKSVVTIIKLNTTPATPPVDRYDYYEETNKPVISFQNVIDFLVGSEETNEVTASKPPILSSPSYSARNESTTNHSSTVIEAARDEIPNQVTSESSLKQEHTNQRPKFEIEDISNATKTPLLISIITETIKQTSTFGVEDSTQASTSPKAPPVPENTNQGSEVDVENFTQATTSYVSSSHTSLISEDVTKEPKPTLEDTKHLNSPPVEENFNEWPEAVTGLPEENLNGDFELVPPLHTLTSENKSRYFSVQKSCTTSQCAAATSTIISSINLTASPCDNFYSFACSGHLSSRGRPIGPPLILDDSLSDLNFIGKFKWFHESCLGHEDYLDYRNRIRRTKSMLNDLGMISNKDVTDVVANLILLDAMPLFNVDIDVTDSMFIFKLIPPDGTLSSKYWSPLGETRRNCLKTIQPENYHSPHDISFLYYDYQECQGNHKHYLKSLKTSIEELGTFKRLNNTQRDELVEDTVKFVQKSLLPILDQTPIYEYQEKIVNLEYATIKIEDLIEQFPVIDWYKFFTVISSTEINTTSSIQMYNKSYFEVLFEKLSLFKLDELINGLSAILSEKYYQELVLPTPKHSRAAYCNKLSRKLFPDISNYLNHRPEVMDDFEERKNYIQSLFLDMKQDFKDSLQKLEWLDERSKTSMRDKITNLRLEMFQDILGEESIYLEELYSKLDLEEGDFISKYYEATKFRRKTFLSIHDKPAETADIFRNFVDNLREEPVFFYGHNTVCVPDALVHKTFMDFPKYLIMAKIGFPLAKVIGHALDPIGLKFGIDLSKNASSTYSKFVQESKRYLPHHLVFNEVELVFSLNSRISEAERIAENTAMALVTKSIEEIRNQPLLPWLSLTFSREKIFFMSLVQEICTDMSLMEFVVQAHENAVLPPQFRVQNILQNSKDFYVEFSCNPSLKRRQLQFPYLPGPKDSDKIMSDRSFSLNKIETFR